ncbi:PhoH family protein [Kangiella sp. HZ709]|uniref:PhoH family protein n=1 Tax=Kangiella sp. HZ709 TaxID=2666328 RepID=UPI0012AEE690|nr:PhoH family protein [Kangiella sp. HZ709]MRX27730.1 AAA family ATPase [Kangiella sp. HZ709]
MADLASQSFELLPADNTRISALVGYLDEHIKHLERRLGVEINLRENQVQVIGSPKNATATRQAIESLYMQTKKRKDLDSADIHLAIQEVMAEQALAEPATNDDVKLITKRGLIKPRSPNQKHYIQAIKHHDISFGIGPAGTGKTYLAVASAVDAWEKQQVRRILLTRPAVEAGERLGFLPGDLAQKVDPYLRPLYDALYEMFGFDKVAKLMERNVIEVAPLAYMRGRTLNDAFIILDESQNTTPEQMKMFLTRIGFNSKAVITGDITQVDLPRGQKSGLRHVIDVLQKVDAISFTFFQSQDVVRHPVVQRIVQAYEAFEKDSD